MNSLRKDHRPSNIKQDLTTIEELSTFTYLGPSYSYVVMVVTVKISKQDLVSSAIQESNLHGSATSVSRSKFNYSSCLLFPLFCVDAKVGHSEQIQNRGSRHPPLPQS